MQIVDIETGTGREGFLRDHPDCPLRIGDCEFVVDDPDRADWLVTMFYTKRTLTTSIPRQRRILLMTEPSGYYPPDYVNQFGILVSPFAVPGFEGIWHQSHGALGSFFGVEYLPQGGIRTRYDYRALANLPVPEERSDDISLVISSKTQLPGHRRRLRFLDQARRALGPRLHVYGRGYRPVAVKADAILPYKYHLVLENTVMPSYWTEKIGDAYVGYAFPIVSGPPDLGRWFPPESFAAIDIAKPEAAIATIVAAMDGALYESRFDAILAARQRLLLSERMAPVIARVIAAHPDAAPRLPAPESVRAIPRPGVLRRIRREAARFYWRVDRRLRSA